MSNMLKAFRIFLGIVCLSPFVLSGLFAQSEAGAALNGTVTDPTGSAVPGAKVTIKSPSTGFARSMDSTGAGLYSFNHLPVGDYELTVEKTGFKTLNQTGITLTVGASATIDLNLQVGSTAETMSVTSDAPIVETTTSNSSSTVDQQSIVGLPVNGRNFIDFTVLTPGVVRDPTRGGDLSFGGQRGTNNSLLVDGADSNNLFYGQATGRTGFRPYAFSEDAVQEFQVNTNTFPAEVGRASGGVINVITRSGTNEFHGTAFEFFRDKGMNANTFVNNRVGAKKNPYHFNQFGGTLGGRVVKDKLFFFLSYDGQRNAQSQIVAPNTPVPASLLSVFGKYLTPYIIGLNNDVGLVKVDWNATQKDHVSVRYNLSRYTGVNQESFGTNVAEEHSGNNEVNTDNVAASWTHVLSPNSLLEARFNFVQDKEPGYANTSGPEVNIINGVLFGANNFSPRYTNGYAYQPVANWTFVHDRHTLKAGFDLNFVKEENYFPGFFAGGYTYNSHADFVNGTPASFRQAFPGSGAQFPVSHPNINEYAGFIQDTWRVTDRLTLNYGLRYDKFDYQQPTYQNPNPQLLAANLRTDRIKTEDADFGPRFGFALRAGKGDSVVIRGGYGIYYSRTPGLLLSTAILNNGFASQTYLLTTNLPSYPSVLKTVPPAGTPPDIYVTDPNFSTGRTQQFSLQAEIAVGTHASITVGYLGVNGIHLTRTRDINLYPSVASTGYICPSFAACTATDGQAVTFYRHPGTGVPARPNPAFGRISLFDSGGNSLYNGGFVRFQRRFANHFTAQASYTWSHVIDTTPDGTSVVPGNAGDDAKVAQDTLLPNLDRGPGASDIRHRVVVSFVWDVSLANSLRNPFVRGVLNHWQLGVIAQGQSGRAFNDIATGDPGNDSNTANDRSPGVGRNTLRGPEFITADGRLSKDIPLKGERVRLRLMGEFFNFTNRANFNGIQTTRYTFSTVGGTNYFRRTTNFLATQTTFDPRIIQLAAKIVF
jgi:hypothetical protein